MTRKLIKKYEFKYANPYTEEYFSIICVKENIPVVFGYYAWLLNDGTGSGIDILQSIVDYKDKLSPENKAEEEVSNENKMKWINWEEQYIYRKWKPLKTIL